MSGSSNKRPPKDDKELAREFDQRLTSLEHPSATRVGKWVLSTGGSGELLASYVGGGSVILSPPPAVGDSPDETEDENQEPPLLFMERTGLQHMNSSTVTSIGWNQVVRSIGTWGIEGSGAQTDLEIPVAGYYLVTLNVAFSTSRNSLTQAVVQIDGDDTYRQAFYPGNTQLRQHAIAFQSYFESGVTMRAWVYGSSSNDFGKSGSYRTTMEINCLRRDTNPGYSEEG